jgi:hypothetical protein
MNRVEHLRNEAVDGNASQAPRMVVLRSPERRVYVAPAILALGDLRDLTLGGSPGVGDSGGGATQKCPGC